MSLLVPLGVVEVLSGEPSDAVPPEASSEGVGIEDVVQQSVVVSLVGKGGQKLITSLVGKWGRGKHVDKSELLLLFGLGDVAEKLGKGFEGLLALRGLGDGLLNCFIDLRLECGGLNGGRGAGLGVAESSDLVRKAIGGNKLLEVLVLGSPHRVVLEKTLDRGVGLRATRLGEGADLLDPLGDLVVLGRGDRVLLHSAQEVVVLLIAKALGEG